jgi:hypothetical protein
MVRNKVCVIFRGTRTFHCTFNRACCLSILITADIHGRLSQDSKKLKSTLKITSQYSRSGLLHERTVGNFRVSNVSGYGCGLLKLDADFFLTLQRLVRLLSSKTHSQSLLPENQSNVERNYTPTELSHTLILLRKPLQLCYLS